MKQVPGRSFSQRVSKRPIEPRVPGTRGIEFCPSALEQNVRSERAVKLAIAVFALIPYRVIMQRFMPYRSQPA